MRKGDSRGRRGSRGDRSRPRSPSASRARTPRSPDPYWSDPSAGGSGSWANRGPRRDRGSASCLLREARSLPPLRASSSPWARRAPAASRSSLLSSGGPKPTPAAPRAGAEVDQVEIGGGSVHGAVHAHRRDHDAVRELELPQTKLREHRRNRKLSPRASREPGLVLRHPLRIPFLQILMADALTSGQERIRELRGLEAGVGAPVLAPPRVVPPRGPG